MKLESELYDLVRRAVRDELADHAAAPEPDLEGLPAAARRFSVSVSWLEARVAAGELALQGRGRMRRLRPSDVRALLRRRNASAETPSARAAVILKTLTGGKRG